MTPTRRRRLIWVSFMVLGIGVAAGLILNAFQKNLLFFFTPTQVLAGEAPKNHTFRIGGLVTKGSVKREPGSLEVSFDVTDTAHTVKVVYNGILPDLFREGQGIVAKGKLGDNGVFAASEVLAKHDENYMPPEVHDALKAAQTVKAQ